MSTRASLVNRPAPKPLLVSPMPPSAGPCGICGATQRWFELFEKPGTYVQFVGEHIGYQRVALCERTDCENGPIQTAERMGWDCET